MAFTNKLSLRSKIFEKGALKKAARTALLHASNEFRTETKNKMIAGPHTGRLYAPRNARSGGRRRGGTRGEQFLRSHRASRPGERLSPDTTNLLNSVLNRSAGDLIREVYVHNRAWYAGYWQEDPEVIARGATRPTMTEKDKEDFSPRALQIFNDFVSRLT